ncbi:MAG: hypothetical protein ACW99U_19295 [Candidatus Thorarchaeota archaeon]
MVKMDIDQEYPQDYFTTMAPLALEYKVIGPEIYDRWEMNNFGILCFADKDDITSWIDCSDAKGIQSYPYTHTNNFYAREVFNGLEMPWYDTQLTPDGFEKANHMDYDFLDKVKANGYEIHINHSVEVNHIFLGKSNRDFYKRNKGDEHGFSRYSLSSR